MHVQRSLALGSSGDFPRRGGGRQPPDDPSAKLMMLPMKLVESQLGFPESLPVLPKGTHRIPARTSNGTHWIPARTSRALWNDAGCVHLSKRVFRLQVLKLLGQCLQNSYMWVRAITLKPMPLTLSRQCSGFLYTQSSHPASGSGWPWGSWRHLSAK